LLVPAGVTVILAGVHQAASISSRPGEALDQLMLAVHAIAPWCQSLLCLGFGVGLISTAGLLLVGGLQLPGS
jgi:hypothetical protein